MTTYRVEFTLTAEFACGVVANDEAAALKAARGLAERKTASLKNVLLSNGAVIKESDEPLVVLEQK